MCFSRLLSLLQASVTNCNPVSPSHGHVEQADGTGQLVLQGAPGEQVLELALAVPGQGLGAQAVQQAQSRSHAVHTQPVLTASGTGPFCTNKMH